MIAILALLFNLSFPALQSARHKAQSVACASNLRQSGICFIACVGDNNNTYPLIEPDPASPVYAASNNARPLIAVLQPYGLTTNVLRCPADVRGDDGPGQSYYSVQTNSYYWRPFLDDETSADPVYYRFGQAIPVSSAKVCVTTDWAPWHQGRANRLYGDGHVKYYSK